MANVARSLVAATSSSRFVEPNYWRDPASGNAFQIQVEIPQHQHGLARGRAEPAGDGERRPRGRCWATWPTSRYGTAMGEVDALQHAAHGQPHGEHARRGRSGDAARDVRAAIERAGEPPQGVTVTVRGQVPPLEQTVSGLRIGLLLSVVVIFLLLAANFQSVRLALRRALHGAGGAVRRGADAAGHRHDAQRAVVHGRDHGDRRGGGERHPAGHVRRDEPARGAQRRWRRRSRARAAACARS